jgi:transcriptional regulator with XRE-family HTH domain
MEPSEIFRIAALKIILEQKRSQVEIAGIMGIDNQQLNGYLNKRRSFSEDRRMILCKALGVSYLDMLNIGQEMIEAERLWLKDESRITHFLQKKIATVMYQTDKYSVDIVQSVKSISIEDFRKTMEGRRQFTEDEKPKLLKALKISSMSELMEIEDHFPEKEYNDSDYFEPPENRPDRDTENAELQAYENSLHEIKLPSDFQDRFPDLTNMIRYVDSAIGLGNPEIATMSEGVLLNYFIKEIGAEAALLILEKDFREALEAFCEGLEKKK